MKEYTQQFYTGERAMYAAKDSKFVDCIFDDGESPLKESSDIEVIGSSFKWKYPLWYCNNVKVKDTNWFDMARAGVWYSNNVSVENALMQAPKNYRRCKNLSLTNVTFTNALETLWSCDGVTLKDVSAKGDYFAMNSKNIKAENFTLDGNYSFDGCENLELRNCKLLTKDAFWNCDNVTVYDSYICGEYLGWNSKNLTLINCTIESLQGMCYVENLKMINCKLINTTLAFEYADVEAEITTKIDSVFNPKNGTISAPEIGELVVEKDKVDPSKTVIKCDKIDKCSEKPEWIK
ncbi:MAG: DUF3737 family protein [Acetatifactor sp.]|nr:DUF3737 family protein [Acetatifactor sp.]